MLISKCSARSKGKVPGVKLFWEKRRQSLPIPEVTLHSRNQSLLTANALSRKHSGELHRNNIAEDSISLLYYFRKITHELRHKVNTQSQYLFVVNEKEPSL